MKKKDRVKSNILFNEIINSGKHIGNKYYVICSLKNSKKVVDKQKTLYYNIEVD